MLPWIWNDVWDFIGFMSIIGIVLGIWLFVVACIVFIINTII